MRTARRVRRWFAAAGRPRRWTAAALAAGLVGLLIPVVTLGGSSSAVPAAVIDQTGGWPDGPYNSQYGTVNIPYRCTVRGFGIPVLHVELDVALSAIFPLDAAAGQDFFVTDGRGTGVLPVASVDLLRGLGVRSLDGRATLFELTAAGARPAVINAAATRDMRVPRTSLVKDQPLRMTLPSGSGLTMGPYRAAGGVVDMGVGSLRLSLSAYGLGGIRLPVPAVLDCPSPTPTRLVALVPIGGKPDPTGVRVQGHIAEARIPVGGGLLGAVIPVACRFDGYGIYTLGINVNAYVPTLFVHQGQRWSFLSGHGYVSLPRELVGALLARHPEAASADVELTELQTISENSVPKYQNYLKGVTAGDPIVLTPGATAFGTFPAGGGMLPPEVSTAGRVGVMRVYLGEVRGSTQLRDSRGGAVGAPVAYDCPTATDPAVPLLPYVVAPG